MSIDQYNAEGYLDPTAYEALSHVEREEKKRLHRPLVFICSPFAGDMEGNAKGRGDTAALRYRKIISP